MFLKVCKFNKLIYFISSFAFVHHHYSKEVISSKYFKTKGSIGWEWAYFDKKNRKLTGRNMMVPFPVNPGTIVNHPENIVFAIDNLEIFQTPGCYFQGIGAKTYFGKGCIVAPNCGFITSNHDFDNYDNHSFGKEIVIGDFCWIGMNCVVLPGVTLGSHTVVGAGSVVTKSFPDGNCVIAGNPAKIIKKL